MARAVQRRDRAVVARALNLLEDRRSPQREQALQLLEALPERRLTTEGHLIGITGPPGVGKSTLVSALIGAWRAVGATVGVLAVDPSSSLSGGALLGDRLRMLRPGDDPGLFIRSLAGRGELGGLSAPLLPMTRLMLAAFDMVVIETVGVGQSEVDVVAQSDTTCLVVQPGAGDLVQFVKAGIVELPALFVVAKADLGGEARRAEGALKSALAATAEAAEAGAWRAPVLRVSAEHGEGVAALVRALGDHRAWLADSGLLEAHRERQVLAWGQKRLLAEFGERGLEAVGGVEGLEGVWATAEGCCLARLERLRERLSPGGQQVVEPTN